MKQKQINVLIIEDQESSYFWVEQELGESRSKSQPSYKLIRASTLQAGLTSLEQHKPDLVLLDLTLPDASGLSGLRTIKTMCPDVPVIVHSGIEDEDTALEAIQAGAQDYLVKGQQKNILSKAVRYALERNQILQELQSARGNAHAASLAKSIFLANMSHEIRTPLSAILGFTELAMSNVQTEEERNKALSAVYRNGQYLLQIINDILDLSKIEAGKLDVEQQTCSPLQILGELEAAMKLKAFQKGISFGFEYEFPLPSTVLTDSTRLKQILYNLIGNGVKFTKQGGVRVIVSCDYEQELLCFDVIDTGIGISEDKLAKLFQPFSQGDRSTTREFGGTGLGLVVAKELAEKLGGSISLQSEVGYGTTISFSVATGALKSVPNIDELPNIVVENKSAEEKHSPPKLKGRVLLAEDAADTRELMCYLLEKAGIEVTVAEDGNTAVRLANSRNFDLVLMDMQMPVMDGYEATKTLRDSGYSKPIVAITASAMAGTEEQCHNAGCSGYISKPFKRDEFYQTLSTYLSSTTVTPSDSSSELSSTVYELLNDDPAFGPIILRFVDNLPKRMEALIDAQQQEEWTLLKQLAHKLVGAELFGFEEITKVARKLEIAAAAEGVERVGELVTKLQSMCEEVCSARSKLTTLIEEAEANSDCGGIP